MPAFDYAQVADLYDSYVRFEDDIPFFLDECRTTPGTVLELMAGTGRVSIPLIEAGIQLTCVDESDEMLAVLNRKLTERKLAASLIRQDVTRLDLSSEFGLAILPFHSFAELVEEEAQRTALASIHRTLLPGGRFICTLHNPAIRLKNVGHGPTVVGPLPRDDGSGEVLLHSDLLYDPSRKIVHGVQVIESFTHSGECVLKRSMSIQFAIIERPSFEKLFHSVGFEADALFGDYHCSSFSPATSPYMIWSLRKVPARRTV